ncbi:MAG: radical SAM protein [Nitrospirae bacterium]|nr:radical SAM protein [Nitrospirota bacterium]
MTDHSLVTRAISDHRRNYLENRFVYPVFSRRSKGISIGINLNPDKVCNFNCIYCQVDRHQPSATHEPDIATIVLELRNILESVKRGDFFSTGPFKKIPKERLPLRDIAFSGDGEPSLFSGFLPLTEEVISLKKELGFPEIKLVMITNGSGLSRPEIQKALELFDKNHGEVWAKLDAGTEAYFRQVCRTQTGFHKILENILQVSQKRPVVIQSCFMKVHDKKPEKSEIEAYIGRLADILALNGTIKLVQIYTVARKPTEEFVSPLEDPELDQIAEAVRTKIKVPVKAYYHASL